MVNPTLNFVKLMEEIERKFLVAGDFKPFVSAGFRITQGSRNTIHQTVGTIVAPCIGINL